MAIKLLVLGLIVSTLSTCKRKDLIPDTAAIIVGNYTAQMTRDTQPVVNFPLSDGTITMQIKRVSEDTVQVDIQSTTTGQYSPGKSLSYPKAYIVSTPDGQGKYVFNVFLTPRIAPNLGSLKDALQFSNSDNSITDYYYVPINGRPSIEVDLVFKRI